MVAFEDDYKRKNMRKNPTSENLLIYDMDFAVVIKVILLKTLN